MLLADLAALGLAPALDGLTRDRPGRHRFLTDLSRVGVAGIVLLDLVPHGWQSLGPLALGLFVAGAVAVAGVERWVAGLDRDGFVGPAALLALGAHHVADGIGLGLGEAPLGVAVVLHAVPVALVAWRIGVQRGGQRLGWATIGWIMLTTLVGFGVGSMGLGAVAERASTGVACALGGGLLHALLHLGPERDRGPWAGVLGGAAGVALLVALLVADPEPGLAEMPPLAIATLVGAALIAVLATRHGRRPSADAVPPG